MSLLTTKVFIESFFVPFAFTCSLKIWLLILLGGAAIESGETFIYRKICLSSSGWNQSLIFDSIVQILGPVVVVYVLYLLCEPCSVSRRRFGPVIFRKWTILMILIAARVVSLRVLTQLEVNWHRGLDPRAMVATMFLLCVVHCVYVL